MIAKIFDGLTRNYFVVGPQNGAISKIVRFQSVEYLCNPSPICTSFSSFTAKIYHTKVFVVIFYLTFTKQQKFNTPLSYSATNFPRVFLRLFLFFILLLMISLFYLNIGNISKDISLPNFVLIW